MHEVSVFGIDPCVAQFAISNGHKSASSFFTSVAYPLGDPSSPLRSRSLIDIDNEFEMLHLLDRGYEAPRLLAYKYRVHSLHAASAIAELFRQACRAAGGLRDSTVVVDLCSGNSNSAKNTISLKTAAELAHLIGLSQAMETNPFFSSSSIVADGPLVSTAAVTTP